MSNDAPPPEGQRAYAIFHPLAMARHFRAAADEHFRFVHYTGASAAMSILQSRSIWMRNVTCMNDYTEIDYGLHCLHAAYAGEHGDKLKVSLDSVHAGICDEIEQLFNGWSPTFAKQTYVFCLSEHRATDEEHKFGRLSMWRAYGNDTRLAIVLRKEPFFTPTEALNAYTSPVEYLTPEGFDEEFGRVTQGIDDNLGFVRTIDRESLKAQVFSMFKYAALCTKHRGFVEEREWRVIYMHDMEPSKRLEHAIVNPNGVPQPVYKIPLKDVPEEGLQGIEIPKVLDRVIIGPTEYPGSTREAFVHLLTNCGVVDAASKVFVSDIPIR